MAATLTAAAIAAALLVLLLLRGHLSRQLIVRLDRLTGRLEKLEGQLPARVDPATPISLRAQCAYLHWALPRQRDSRKVLFYPTARAEISALEARVDDLERGVDPLSGQRGVSLRAYRSPVDGDVTTYSLRVPADYEAGRAWPLVVHLHGRGRLQPFQGHRAPDYGDRVVVIAPHGKGSVDFMGPGEVDVLAAIGEVERLYRIDTDRVYLAGASMGGTGAWHLAAHYPDRFAAIVVASGNADDRVWEELWEGGGAEAPEGSVRGALKKLERYDSPVTYAANLLHVPARVIHGEDDLIVPVEHARRMVSAVGRGGGRVEYRELVGAGHNVSYGKNLEQQAEWLLRHRRAQRPAKVRYATDGRWPGAYWLTRVEPESALALAEVEAEVTGAAELRVSTSGCGRLAIDLGAAPLKDHGAVRVVIDGQGLEGLRRGQLFLARKGGRWERQTDLPPYRLRGFSQIFWRRFAVVYGTAAGDAKLGAALRRESERLAAEWRRRYFASPAVYSDAEVPEEILESCGLVLFGGPEENSVTARVLEAAANRGAEVPFLFAGGTVTISGVPSAEVDSETLGLQFVWPSPFAPRRLVGVVWGASWRALVDCGNRFGRDFDWTVYENRRWFDYALYDAGTAGPESFVRVGFYRPAGGLDPDLAWGRPPGGGGKAPGSAPRYMRVAEAPEGKALWLDELLPAEVHQMRGPVGYGRSWGGKRLRAGRAGREFDRGLGIRGPCRLVYDLRGCFKRLRATIGADLEGRGIEDLSDPRVEHGAMFFRVSGDGRELYASEALGPAQEAVDIDVDLSGVVRLTLEVVPAGKYEWHLGSGAWADARLER